MAVVDSYTGSAGSAFSLFFGALGAAQSFTGNGYTLDSAVFKLIKAGSPATTLTAKIYAHSGTFGSTGIATGSALATSDIVSASGVSTSAGDVTFTFSGANRITLIDTTKYVVSVEVSSTGDFSHYYSVHYNNTSGGHSGNMSTSSGSWTGVTWDAYFIVNGSPAVTRRIFII